MPEGWAREDDSDAAIDKILDAAGKAFAELGVSAAGMAEIAEAAGCSRGTLYRYFPSRHELHVAYVKRKAGEIQGRLGGAVAGISDPRERWVAFILGAVREVRNDPATLAWFAPGVSAVAPRMSRSDELVAILADAFAPEARGRARDARGRLRRRWIVRVIVSLLSDPGESATEERRLVEGFVVPGLVAG